MSESDSRIEKLEKEVSELKSKLENAAVSTKKEKAPRAPREPSKYNLFMQQHLASEKKRLGEKYDHKAAFKSAGEAWSKSKK